MRQAYIDGLDILGAVGAQGQETNRAILIRVNNAAQLARSQGAIASLAQTVAPATIEGKVYDEIAKKISEALKKEHVDATVNVAEPVGWKSADGKQVWSDVGLALGGVGIIALVWGLFVRGGSK